MQKVHLIDQMLAISNNEQLKSLIYDFEIICDKRSSSEMRNSITSTFSAAPEQLIDELFSLLSVRQIKDLCEIYGIHRVGLKEQLIERLLAAIDESPTLSTPYPAYTTSAPGSSRISPIAPAIRTAHLHISYADPESSPHF